MQSRDVFFRLSCLTKSDKFVVPVVYQESHDSIDSYFGKNIEKLFKLKLRELNPVEVTLNNWLTDVPDSKMKELFETLHHSGVKTIILDVKDRDENYLERLHAQLKKILMVNKLKFNFHCEVMPELQEKWYARFKSVCSRQRSQAIFLQAKVPPVESHSEVEKVSVSI